MHFFSALGYLLLAIYLFVGLCSFLHIMELRIDYHKRFKELVKKNELDNKYPSGISWLDSQNHWMTKGFTSSEDKKLKKIGELLFEVLPFIPPPQNLLFPLQYPGWLKKHWKEFKEW